MSTVKGPVYTKRSTTTNHRIVPMIFESHFGSSAPQFIQNTTPNDPPSKTIVPHQAKIVKLKSNSSRACKPTKTSRKLTIYFFIISKQFAPAQVQ